MRDGDETYDDSAMLDTLVGEYAEESLRTLSVGADRKSSSGIACANVN